MPKYRITAPDGRVVTISGDHEPSMDDLQAIFAELPPVEQPKAEQPSEPVVSGALTRANDLLSATARGMPVVGGLFDKYNAAWDASTDYLLDKLGAPVPQKPDGTPASWRDRYDRALAKERANAAAFESAHPYQAGGAGLAGGFLLPLGAAAPAKTLGAALKSGALVGGGLGAADAFVRSEGDPTATIMGGIMGAPMGALGGGVGYGATKLSGALKQMPSRVRPSTVNPGAENVLTPRQAKMLAEDVGGRDILDKLVVKARDKNVSLAEVGDANISRALEKANISSPSARRTIANAAEARATQSAADTAAIFDETLGIKKGLQSLDVLEADYAKQAQPLYNKAFKHTVDGKTMMELQKNTLIGDAINDVNKHYGSYFGGRAKVEPNSVEYLDGLKRSIDNRIAGEINSPAPDMKKVAFLESARDEILKAADQVAPTYRYARNTSSNKFEIGDAYKLGEKVFDGHMTTEEFITKIKEVNKTPAARDALKMGVRATLTDKLGAKTSEATTFSKLITPNAQAKIKALIGENEGQKLIDYARKQYNWNQTMSKATQGSPTAQRMQLAEEAVGPVSNLVRGNPVAAGGQVVGSVLQKGAKAIGRASDDTNYNAIANALLKPASDLSVTPSRAQVARDAATNAILRALGGVGVATDKAAPVIKTFPIRATGVTNQELLKALGY